MDFSSNASMNDETSQTTHESGHGDAAIGSDEGAAPEVEQPQVKSGSELGVQKDHDNYDDSIFEIR
jgi:hypothetical protein